MVATKVWAAALIVVGLLVLNLGYGFYQDSSELADMEPVTPGELDAADGEVVMEGVAQSADDQPTLETQYRNQPAIAHEWREERQREPGSAQQDDSMTDWTTEDLGEDVVDFYVSGGAGETRVDTSSASVNLDTSVVERGSSTRYSEGALQSGDQVFVHGYADEGEDGAVITSGGDVGNVNVRDGTHEEAVAGGYLASAIIMFVGAGFVLVGAGMYLKRRT